MRLATWVWWLMLVALTAGLVLVHALPGGAAGAGEPSNPQLQVFARYMLGAHAMDDVGATDTVDLLEALDVQAHSAIDRFRVITVRGELQGADIGNQEVDQGNRIGRHDYDPRRLCACTDERAAAEAAPTVPETHRIRIF